MESIATKLTAILSGQGIISDDERSIQIHKFGFYRLLSVSSILLCAITVALITWTPIESVLFFLGFMLARMIDNVHLDKHYQCLLFSISTQVLMIVSIAVMSPHEALFVSVALCSATILCTVLHYVIRQNDRQQMLRGSVLLLIYCGVGIIAAVIGFAAYSLPFTIGIFVIGILREIRRDTNEHAEEKKS